MANKTAILKNSAFLYFRMLLTMGVSLYTVRVVLNTLGAVDYGIYNVIGGVVIMFSFISNSMASASQRFFAVELGRENYTQLNRIFSLTMLIYILIAVVIVVLAETLGLWFLNTKMSIPAGRMEAANWVYQFSILSLVMTMFTTPYNALTIAHEKMNMYAYVSILEVVLKLTIVYLLVVFSADKLKLYSILMFGVTTTITFVYRTYCRRRFKESKFVYYWDKALFRQIIGYSGWSLLGVSIGVVRNHGVNILINLFFNPVVNAAQAIATQINATLMNFSNNFYMAMRPQIIKSYSANKTAELSQLVFSSAKFAFYVMLFLAIPLLFETDYILNLWIKNNVPTYTVVFVRIITINTLIEVINSPVITTIQASGQLKWYQLTTSVIQLMILPITYIFYKNNMEPQWAYYTMVVLALISNIPRFRVFQKVSSISGKDYLNKVVLGIVTLLVVGVVPLLLLYNYYIDSPHRMIIVALYDILVIPPLVYFVGLDHKERSFVKNTIGSKLNKSKK